MLVEKEKTFDWLIPTSPQQGRQVTEDFRASLKHNTLYVSNGFLEKYYKGTDLHDVHVAFLGLNNDESPMVVINPNAGVPFFKFSASKGNAKNPNPCKSNKILCDLIAKKFNADRNCTLSFKLVPFQRFSGMMFYSMVLDK